MREYHFYVENARLMSEGLSNIGIGTPDSILEPSLNEDSSSLAGKLIGLGMCGDTSRNIKLFGEYSCSKDPFVRRSAYIGAALSGYLDQNEDISNILKKGFFDDDIEIRKSSIIGYGLANFARGDPSNTKILDELMQSTEWKIRSAVGLAYSTMYIGNPTEFGKFFEILKNEESPYVKVCSCWYISLAFANTGKGLDEYKKLLSMEGDENSFFRDMACLGMGYSFLGKNDPRVAEILEERILTDTHPYVRESACFGLALNNFEVPTSRSKEILNKAMNEDSMIVRSGAALGAGIMSMKAGKMPVDHRIMQSDPSVLWGLNISEGLIGSPKSHKNGGDNYVNWGGYLGDGFRHDVLVDDDSVHQDLSRFQKYVNQGLKNIRLGSKGERDAFRLFFPGSYYYSIYDSFWWGLWVLSSLGHVLKMNEGK